MKKIIVIVFLLIVTPLGVFSASTIGTVNIQGSGSSNIIWNDTFGNTGNASGSVNLQIRGRILPTLNMIVGGTGTIDLGNLSSLQTSSGGVYIEIGTNISNGASVTVRSQNGGMKNTSNSTYILNSTTTDGLVDSYTYESVLGSQIDSDITGFSASGLAKTEISNTNSFTIYSSNKPEKLSNLDDVHFIVGVKPNDQSPAGDYSDTVILTVTGNF